MNFCFDVCLPAGHFETRVYAATSLKLGACAVRTQVQSEMSKRLKHTHSKKSRKQARRRALKKHFLRYQRRLFLSKRSFFSGFGFGIWDLGFGIWDLGFGFGLGPGLGLLDYMYTPAWHTHTLLGEQCSGLETDWTIRYWPSLTPPSLTLFEREKRHACTTS